MAKIVRQFLKRFGNNSPAVQLKKFGSLAEGAPAAAETPEEIQELAGFDNGWSSAVLGNNSPTIEDRNSLDYLFGYQLSYLMQQGIPEWNAETEYHTDSFVTSGGTIYKSRVDDNINHPIRDGASWIELGRAERLNPLPPNLIQSGNRNEYNQVEFLAVHDTEKTLTIVAGELENQLIFYINNYRVNVTADIVLENLTGAPSLNNTCTLNESGANGQVDTLTWGEFGNPHHVLRIDNIGSEISDRRGEFAAFRVGTDEIFIAKIGVGSLYNARRGFFYGQDSRPINPSLLSNNQVLYLLSTAWVFADKDGTSAVVTYNNPKWEATAPALSEEGDFWFDLKEHTWKVFSSNSYVLADKLFIGLVVLDTEGSVGANCASIHKNFSDENSIEAERVTIASVSLASLGERVSVNGSLIETGFGFGDWTLPDDLAPSQYLFLQGERASTYYYFYIDENGTKRISDLAPIFLPDLRGYYHRGAPWRCVAKAYNDSSSNLNVANSYEYNNAKTLHIETALYRHIANSGSSAQRIPYYHDAIQVPEGRVIQAENSSVSGLHFTAATKCLVSGNLIMLATGGGRDQAGFSLNSTQLSTSIDVISRETRVAIAEYAAQSGDYWCCPSFSIVMQAGDVLRAHLSTADRYDQLRATLNLTALQEK